MTEGTEIEVTPEQSFSGSYGFVIIPDNTTQVEAIKLARQLGPDAQFRPTVPHVTLYHARFKDLPREQVQEVLEQLTQIKSSQLSLGKIQIYGGKFLFWNIDKTDGIQKMHETALSISQYLDKDSVARAVDEGLELTEIERQQMHYYGNPLVRDLYAPHITLAYDSKGLALPQANTKEWNMTIGEIAFAEIGDFGRVKRIIHLDSDK